MGDMASAMYVIKDGECTILSDDREISDQILKSGDFFGNSEMFLQTSRTKTVKARTHCALFELMRFVSDGCLSWPIWTNLFQR